ncbi:DUF4190 domain-containing protein [Lacisediminihabitans changchengi]|uniref:DUF4190 domain-containing protein n=1 Tax=Lacisediminihabitans changchengi TaxID=2787634 RepID=A0A934SII9_9MICO|nr:DUF4190 domain-containing protein [Lacisediminihabitans changchengi]MBK4347302.1 DUF4190 domain-containing protein [Lacisediminihabitans changchengi]
MTQLTAPAKTNTLALVGFIAAFMIPVVGVVLGAIARRQLSFPGTHESGRGLARWAMIIGILGTLAQVSFFVIWVASVAQLLFPPSAGL